MRETKAVAIGFGLVAVGLVGVAVYFLAGVAWVMKPTGGTVDDPIGKAFRAAPHGGNGAVDPAPAVEALLIPGTPAGTVIARLTDAEFQCTRQDAEAFCSRTVVGSSASETWKVIMTFDEADRLVSRRATRKGQSL